MVPDEGDQIIFPQGLNYHYNKIAESNFKASNFIKNAHFLTALRIFLKNYPITIAKF